MIPWSKIEDLSIRVGEYFQANVPNRIFNRLLDNDKSLEDQFDSLHLSSCAIEPATRTELKELELSGKTVSPEIIMALSATPSDMENEVSGRFVTVDEYLDYINGLPTYVPYIDISHVGVLQKWPSADYISTLAKDVIPDYSPATSAVIDVLFLYDREEPKNKYEKEWYSGLGGKPLGAGRYRYLITNGTNWEFKDKILNDNGKLTE